MYIFGKIKAIFILVFFLFLFVSCRGATKQKEIYASEILTLINKGKSVQICDKIIFGDLDFSEAKITYSSSVSSIQIPVRSDIFFVNCVFMGKVTTIGLHQKMQKTTLFKKNVTFFKCDFRGEVNFESTVFQGDIDFSHSVFRAKTSFNEITSFGKKNLFSGLISESSFDMINVLIHGNLNFMNAKFQSNASFQSMTVNTLQFSNAVFEKKTDFSNMVVYKNSFFNYVTYSENVFFSFSKFYGDADFLNSSFEQEADFSGSFYYGRTRFTDSTFKGEAIFLNSVFILPPEMENTTLKKAIEIQVIESKKIIFK